MQIRVVQGERALAADNRHLGEFDLAGIAPAPRGTPVIDGIVPRVAALLFTANDCLDVGQSLGSAVSMDYRKRAPFKFNGTIHQMNVDYTD